MLHHQMLNWKFRAWNTHCNKHPKARPRKLSALPFSHTSFSQNRKLQVNSLPPPQCTFLPAMCPMHVRHSPCNALCQCGCPPTRHPFKPSQGRRPNTSLAKASTQALTPSCPLHAMLVIGSRLTDSSLATRSLLSEKLSGHHGSRDSTVVRQSRISVATLAAQGRLGVRHSECCAPVL